jgi:hypothetical protein
VAEVAAPEADDLLDDTMDGSDELDGATDVADPPRRGGWRDVAMAAALALVVGAMAALMYSTHRPGHWWGDDWALYIRQAQGLLDGHPNRVLQENEFTVAMSRGSEFSPPLYPWGFPILMVPFIAIVGADLDALSIVQVLSACLFACCWYSLARRRLPFVPSLVGVVAVTITPLLLSWTELIQSEWPFLAAVGVALVLLDRIAASGALTDHHRRIAPLVVVGVAAAFAFSVRREGLAMVAAIGAAQVAALVAAGFEPWRPFDRRSRMLIARLALPHATFLAFVGLLQVTLPSTVVPKYDGTSLANVWELRGRLVRNLAQISGLQRPWDKDPVVLGSATFGWWLLGLYLILAVLGIVYAAFRWRTRDLHLAAYALAAYCIGGSFRSPINRYVATVAPLLMIFALVATYVFLSRFVHRHVGTAVITIALLAVVAGNMANAKLRVEGANRTRDAGAIEWGPTHPDALVMFEQVEALTEPGDVVASPKARAMVLETGRPSIQVDDYRPIPDDLDLALIVVEFNQDRRLATAIADQPDQYREIWSNTRFRLYVPTGD